MKLELLPLEKTGESVAETQETLDLQDARQRWRQWSEVAAENERAQLPTMARRLEPSQFARLLQPPTSVSAPPMLLEEPSTLIAVPEENVLPIRPDVKGQCLLVPINPSLVCSQTRHANNLTITLLSGGGLHVVQIDHLRNVLLLLRLLSNCLFQGVHERVLNANVLLRARLVVVHSLRVILLPCRHSHTTRGRPLLHLFLRHLALRLRQIHLVAHNHEGEVQRVRGRRSHEEVVLPLLQILEGLRLTKRTLSYAGIRQVEGEDACVRASVERGAKTLETLLSGGIPNLHHSAESAQSAPEACRAHHQLPHRGRKSPRQS